MTITTNADITMYNYWYNPETKAKEYKGTQISGVHWYTDQKVAVGDKGIISDDLYKIRIPSSAVIEDNRVYAVPELYARLSCEEIGKYWTIDKDDLFVKGLMNDHVEKGSDLKTRHREVGRVNSYSDNRSCSNPHFRIGGAV